MADVVGVLPAAGRGVRAYPYSATVPKSMLQVDGVPNLQRNVEIMRDALGIREVRIVVGHHGDVIRSHFRDGSAFGVRITYVENPRIDLELAYSVYLATRDVTTACCVILADECYVASNHAAFLSEADPDAEVVCGIMVAEYAKQIRKNYAVELRDGLIVDLIEKPTRVTDGLMGVGTYLLRPEVLRRLAAAWEGDLTGRPRDWTGWLGVLARGGVRVAPFRLTGRYVNINSRDDLNLANYVVRDLHFDARRKSLVYVVDTAEEEAAQVVSRYAAEADVDEVVAVARRRTPALEQVADGTRIRLVVPPTPDTSIGELVRLGLDSARGSILLLAHSEDTFAPRDVSKFLVYLRDADMVVGTRTTRQMIEQGTNMRGVVRIAHIMLAKLLQVLWWRFECRFTDICCVYRALWRSTYLGIRDQLTASGVEVFPEMVIEVLRARRRIIEIPVNYYCRDLEYLQVHAEQQTVATFRRVMGLLLRRRLADLPLAGRSGKLRAPLLR